MHGAALPDLRRGGSSSSLSTTTPSSLNSMDQAAFSALPTAHLVLAALRSVYGLCQQIRDRPRAALQAHARLHQAFLRVASVAKHGNLPGTFRLSHYTAVLTQLKSLLEQHLRLRDIVARVLASRRLLSGLARVHHDINVLLVDFSLASASSSLLEWKPQFAANRQQDEKHLHDTLMALLSTPTFVNKEFPSERRQALVLLELVAEFAASETPRGHSIQLLETLKMTHRRISNLCDLHLRRVPRWFLPGCEVDFSLNEHSIGYSRGSFGSTLQRGEAYRYNYTSDGALATSSTSTVAVKCLWALPDVQYQIVEQLFARSGVSKWTRVRHPNVVPVRGASHAANPPFLVRDFTTYGGLTAYLAALETRAKECAGPESSGKVDSLTWQLLYGASRGLLHLHEQHGIVHGGLRCNNLLVDKKGRAVVADFGVYTLACDARDSGLTEYFQLDVFDADAEELIRWQAPECLREHVAYRESLHSLSETGSGLVASNTSASATSFATDVYAFGMCILEALTRMVPWAGLEISEIRNLKGNLGLLPPRPKRLSPQAWTLIEKMCATDPHERISLSEASQELKRLGYGNRVTSRSRDSSIKDLEALESAAIAKVDRVSSSLEEASKEVKQFEFSDKPSTRSRGNSGVSSGSRDDKASSGSRSNSVKDFRSLECPPIAKVECLSNSLEEASKELKQLGFSDKASIRSHGSNKSFIGSRNSSTKDLEALEPDTAAKVEQVSNSLEEASQQLKHLSEHSRNSSHADLGDVEKEASQQLVCVSNLLNLASLELKRLGIGDKVTNGLSSTGSSTLDLVAMAQEAIAKLGRVPSDENLSNHSGDAAVAEELQPNSEVEAVSSKEEEGPLAAVKEDTKLLEGRPVIPDKHFTDFSAPSEASTVKQTARRLRYQNSSLSDKRQSSRKLGDEAVTGNFWESGAPPKPEVDGSGNIWDHLAQDPKAPCSREVVRSMHAVQSVEEDEGGTTSELNGDKTGEDEVGSVHSADSEQPEHEIDYDNRSSKSASIEEDKVTKPAISSSDEEEDEVTKALEELTADESSMGEEDFIGDTSSMICEFQTARSYDVEDEVSSVSLHHPVVEQLESLRAEGRNEAELVDTLTKMKDDLELSTAWLVVERDGLLAFMELVWRDYSEACTKLSLELLQAIAALSPEFVIALVNSKVVKVLLGVIKHRTSPQQVNLAASFLLELIANNDEVKNQLWKCRGIAVMEDSPVIDRRLVQEVKSIMAKYKRSEGYKCLNDNEYHLAIDKFSEAIALDRKRAGYYGDRSLAYMEASMFKKAADDAYRCMRYNPYDATGYLRHGLALKAMGKYKEAMASLRKGTEVDPKFAKIRDVLGDVEMLLKARNNGGGATTVRRMTAAEAAKLKKKDGDDALRKKKFELAIKCYSQAIELDPRNDWIYLHRSIANAACGEHAKAIDDASKCIRINYRQVEGYYRLALALHAAGQQDQALNTLYRGQEVDPRHSGITRFISQLEEEQAKTAGLQLPEWFKEKGYRAFQLRSYEDAVKYYSKAIDASQSDGDEVTMHCYLYRSRAHHQRGEFAAVIADCSYVLEHRPQNVFARLRRADAYEQQRDFHMALYDIRELVALNPEYKDAQARLLSLEHRCRLLPGSSLSKGAVKLNNGV
ncbi:Leucine-rich repeat serine/threonine-protein kinase 2 [Phytophthora boehmeriae]|uniref:Leucine-rich repeat serine/threonine-protein kinase 2 n=1 Tax=Phytophthora boehmeriae TaxID=109152 RepID=A0A8T1XG28_9STRA|nr:Leucine-rich repeat serine/threonine-protein kinase 2 [Phytophthora boehmeriae]